jgi:hypothetical protein
MGISHAEQNRSNTMKLYKTALAVALGTLFTGVALAQSNYSIEQRDRAEQARIDRGVQSGQLTSREAARLQGERAQIERLEARARADGTLSRSERARIDNAQDRLSRDIYRETHDNQTARSGGRTPDRWNGSGRGYGHDQRDFGHGRGSHQSDQRGWRGNDSHVRHESNGRSEAHVRSEANVRNEPRGNSASTGSSSHANSGRSEQAPGRQPHAQQSQAQRTHVQQAQASTGSRSDRRTR